MLEDILESEASLNCAQQRPCGLALARVLFIPASTRSRRRRRLSRQYPYTPRG